MMKEREVKRAVKGEDYTVKRVIEVCETKRYDLFKYDSKNNREVETDTTHFENLKASIEKEGLKDPIWVVEEVVDKEEFFVIAAGQHRFEACKQLGIPVEFIIVNDDSYSLLLRVILDALTKKNTLKDFIDMGAARGYKIFKLVKQVVQDFGVEFNNKYSAAFETVFTICANRKEKLYRNSRFMSLCKKTPEITNKTLNQYANWPVYKDEIDEIYSHTRVVADIASVIGKDRIGVNFNREMLKLLTPAREVESSPKEILAYLSKKSSSGLREDLRKVYSAKDSEIRRVLKKIDKQILSSDAVSKRRLGRISIVPDIEEEEGKEKKTSDR